MSIRDLYFKIYVIDEVATMKFSYSQKDVFGIVRVEYVLIDFNLDHEMNIKRLEEIEESTPGFMFWNNSEEGIKFWNTNPTIWHYGNYNPNEGLYE